jgi:UDP-glucose:(glucosyl)LPS alpha-1,2-glucosyltransferase
MEVNELSKNAKGGTELMMERLHASVDKELLDQCQIIPSRVRELDETKIRILWQHDLPGDPESEHLKNGGHDRFHKIVFVSNWQMQAYINHYNIPWSKCVVMQNAITPIAPQEKSKDKIKLIYTPTPHRGLQILVPVFEKLCEEFDNIELDVYSSFKLYGWEERDTPYQELFDRCKTNPKINYYGTVDNDELRLALSKAHIFAYPSIWPETSCLCLLEAMSAGLVCVHPNFAALPETAANWSYMYQWNENPSEHAATFHMILSDAIRSIDDSHVKNKLDFQKSYIDGFYNWEGRKHQWSALIRSLLNEPREFPKATWVYRTT